MYYKRNIVFIICFKIVCFLSRLITGVGVSLADMRKHVMREIPELAERGISRDAIHMLLQPLHKNSTRSQRYKSLIDAKVPGKRNQYWEGSANQHFLFAMVSYREDLLPSLLMSVPSFHVTT